MAFDLGEYKQSTVDIAEVDIFHPVTGESMGMKISVLSPDSDEYRKAVLKQQNESIKFVRRNRKTTAEKMEEDGVTLLASVTVGWEGVLENGQPLPFSTENAKRIYKQFPFIKEQVDEFTGDRRNFMKS